VVPSDAGDLAGPRILQAELARAIRFGSDADNPAVVDDLRALAVRAGIDYEALLDEGVEEDDD
jgi:hypothetical protein